MSQKSLIGVICLLVIGRSFAQTATPDSGVSFPGKKEPNEPKTEFATAQVNCVNSMDGSGSTFNISTGTGNGECTIRYDHGRVSGGRCQDGRNRSEASCRENNSHGACGKTQGRGWCHRK